MEAVVDFFKGLKNKFEMRNISFDIDSTSPDPANRLPLELTLHILSFLDVKNLGTCSRLSKKWRVISEMNDVWQPLFVSRFRKEPPKLGDTKKNYRLALEEEKKRKAEEEVERRRMIARKFSRNEMVCRMFHPSNGRDNFEPLPAPEDWQCFNRNDLAELKKTLPNKDVLKKMLAREDELRLSDEVQNRYRWDPMTTKVTEDVQRQVVQEFGFDDIRILRTAVALYRDDPEIASIPHYVKYNRSRLGHLSEGCDVPDVPLYHLDAKTKTSLQTLIDNYQERDRFTRKTCGLAAKATDEPGRPLVLIAGSWT
eukprot:TRINITY_DN1461_c0_g1_i1.p1 TRINITY_DN1461_c0_g1~~TRINITY_DN1461_c0_g1_i1.p1  ORF type:complete len:311 (-),score=87.17 TRINITY_DN1461_c0_g1_i1:772-1704(-)